MSAQPQQVGSDWSAVTAAADELAAIRPGWTLDMLAKEAAKSSGECVEVICTRFVPVSASRADGHIAIHELGEGLRDLLAAFRAEVDVGEV